MIQKNNIEIDAKDFVRGMTTSKHTTDGGFSPETTKINPLISPGAIYAPSALVDSDTDTRLTGNIIATSPDVGPGLPTNRLLVADNGSYYTYNGTKIPAAALATDSANTYAKGFTDMITFAGRVYITTKQRLVEWQRPSTFDFASAGSATWTFTNSTLGHPALNYENNAFYGDGNLLLKQTAAGGALATALTLETDQVIISLGIDPGTGYMLIATTTGLNYSNGSPVINKILWYDGFSTKPVKAAIVDDMVFGFYAMGGTVFIGYGQNIGYLSGSGIVFLRKLASLPTSSDYLPYKNNFTNLDKILLVADGLQILAFGEIERGQKVFFYIARNDINTNKLLAIFYGGSGKIGLTFATNKFYTLDTTSSSTIDSPNVYFYSVKYNFPRPVFIRSAFVEWASSVANNGNPAVLYVLDEKGTTTTFSSLQNTTGAAAYFVETKKLDKKVRMAQFSVLFQNINPGIRRISIGYDVAE